MKRLLDIPVQDRLTARAHTLVRAVGATVESEERMLRSRFALDAPRPQAAPRRPSGAPWRKRSWLCASRHLRLATTVAGKALAARRFDRQPK